MRNVSQSVMVVIPTFDYGKHLRSIGHRSHVSGLSSQLTDCIPSSLSYSDSGSSLSTMSGLSSLSASTMSHCDSTLSIISALSHLSDSSLSLTESHCSLSSTESQNNSPKTTPASPQTQHSLESSGQPQASSSTAGQFPVQSNSRSSRSLHVILPLPDSPPSLLTPAPVCSGTTVYGELANTVSAISLAAMVVVGGIRRVCSKVKRRIELSRKVKYAYGNSMPQHCEEMHDIGLLKCKKCAITAESRQDSHITIPCNQDDSVYNH